MIVFQALSREEISIFSNRTHVTISSSALYLKIKIKIFFLDFET